MCSAIFSLGGARCFIAVLSILLGRGCSFRFVLLTALSCFLAKGLTPDEEEDTRRGSGPVYTRVWNLDHRIGWISGLDPHMAGCKQVP